MREAAHSMLAMWQAAHNTDYYITKYGTKALEQLQNLVALMDATTRKGESIFTMNLIPKRNIPVIPELARGPKVPRSRLQRDIEALLRP